MSMKRIVVVGAGGHGKVVADAVRAGDAFEVAAFADELATQRDGDLFLGARIIAGDGALARARELGIGYAIAAFADCKARLGCCERLLAHGFEIVTVVHPRAIVAGDVTIGAGTFLAAGAIVGTATVLGESAIINTGAIVDHDCVLEDAVHVEQGACLGARVRVGRVTTIGIGATVTKDRRIGAHAWIAPATLLTCDVEDGAMLS